MKHRWMLAMVFAALATSAGAAPRFEAYPSISVSAHSGKILLRDAKSRHYATVLREAARRKPDFAGRYILASWGCGAACVLSAAIDATTGAVSWLPFTVCCWEAAIEKPLAYRKDSHLLIVHGGRDEQGGGVHYYDFDGRKFSLIAVPSS